jgi:excinuclease ABC subunit A
VIDLGPEGGEAGGYIIAEGRPERVAQVAQSHTGQFLAKVLAEAKGGRARIGECGGSA